MNNKLVPIQTMLLPIYVDDFENLQEVKNENWRDFTAR